MSFNRIIHLLSISLFLIIFTIDCAKTQFFGGKGPKKNGPITTSTNPDADSDKDGIPDVVEIPKGDTDKDGVPDYLDTDDDNDGVATLYEGTESQWNKPGSDDNTPGSGNGTVPLIPTGTNNTVQIPDSDHDGIPDYLDPDDDNDTIPSVQEDINNNGNPQDDDTDGDGLPNYIDPDDDNDGILTKDEDINHNGDLNDDDTDGDGIPNYLDPDDDGDGIPTIQEDTNHNGDPRDDDVDSDGKPNYLDPNDDNDQKPTKLEDTNGNGNSIDDDDDGDGIPNPYDPDDSNPNTPDPGQGYPPAPECTGGTNDQGPVFCRCLTYDVNRYPVYVNAYDLGSYQNIIIDDFNRNAGSGPNYQYERLKFMKEHFHEGRVINQNLLFNTFCMENFNVWDRRFTDGFPFTLDNGSPSIINRIEWFALDAYAKIVIPENDTWEFQIFSDDGAQLFIDNQLVVDNDGMHSPLYKSGSISLSAGEHNLRIKYFQGPKFRIALQLFWRRLGVPGYFYIVPRENLRFSGKF